MLRSFCLRSLFAVLLIVKASPMFGAESRDHQHEDVIVGARCRLRCLTLFKSHFKGVQHGGISLLSGCKEDDQCNWCTWPCDQLSLNISQCQQLCSGSVGAKTCLESCHFLLQVNSIRPGTCPPERRVTGTAARCVKSCEDDSDCDRRLRCCSNGCGWTCQHPTHTNDGMPEIPLVPEILGSSTADDITLKWNAISNASGPVLYLVESRFFIGQQLYGGEAWSPWIQVTQTTDVALTVNKLRPGHFYQFCVSAINIYGTQGPSMPTKPYKTFIEPSRPNPPTNVTEGETFVADGQIAVSIGWSPPTESDLPISRYKIYWRRRSRGQSMSAFSSQEFRQVVPAGQLRFQIAGLEPNSTYFVQVQAISQFGETRLKSDRSAVYINTISLRQPLEQKISSSEPMVLSRSFVTPSSPTSLFVDPVYYQNGLLRANVSWDLYDDDVLGSGVKKFVVQWLPEACASGNEEGVIPVMSSATDASSFVIYDLWFDCCYVIRVQQISPDGIRGAIAHTSISTPSCNQVLVIGEVQPDCPHNVPRIPDEPPDLSHSFIITGTSITCKLNWGMPSSDSPVTGYQVVWGQVLPDSQLFLMDKTTAVSKSLPKDARSLNIGGLSEAASYVVQIQAMSKAGTGRVSSLRFTTPHLQVLPADPSYKELAEVDNVLRPVTKKRHGANIILANVATVQAQPSEESKARMSPTSSIADVWFDQLLLQATSSSPSAVFKRTDSWILVVVLLSAVMLDV